VINEGKYVTYDLGGNATTSQMAEQIAARAAKMVTSK
jgi:isocitrate/isopropylmalate dehydrogenase